MNLKTLKPGLRSRITLTMLPLVAGLAWLGCGDDGSMSGSCDDPPGACVKVKGESSVEGKYIAADGETVSFSASSDDGTARASFTAGDVRAEVEVTSPSDATLTIDDMTMDGNGELDYAGTAIIASLESGPLAEAIAMVPLELGCDDDVVDDALMAAALFAWQLRIKYADGDREISVPSLAGQAPCVYFDDPSIPASSNGPVPNGALRLAAETPVPNAYGFFPLDEVGAAPGLTAYTDPAKLYGACGSRCRGACGPDCTRANCKETIDWRCLTDGDTFTGEKMNWMVLNCGIHAGCVMHDQCYDDCLRAHGCGSWSAGWCMHDVYGGCDVTAAAMFGTGNCWSWKSGGGPFQYREDFEYPLGDIVFDETTCPPGTADGDADSDADGDADTDVDTDTSTCDDVAGAAPLSGTYPAEAWNGMQINYSVSGPATAEYTDSDGFTTSRTYTGCMGTGTFTVSGSADMANGYGANLSVSVNAGGESDTFGVYLTTIPDSIVSESFNISVPIPEGASGSFSIGMTGDYNAGTRGLIVSGTFE